MIPEFIVSNFTPEDRQANASELLDDAHYDGGFYLVSSNNPDLRRNPEVVRLIGTRMLGRGVNHAPYLVNLPSFARNQQSAHYCFTGLGQMDESQAGQTMSWMANPEHANPVSEFCRQHMHWFSWTELVPNSIEGMYHADRAFADRYDLPSRIANEFFRNYRSTGGAGPGYRARPSDIFQEHRRSELPRSTDIYSRYMGRPIQPTPHEVDFRAVEERVVDEAQALQLRLLHEVLGVTYDPAPTPKPENINPPRRQLEF